MGDDGYAYIVDSYSGGSIWAWDPWGSGDPWPFQIDAPLGGQPNVTAVAIGGWHATP
jgi:hypothetical protein